MQVQLPQTVNKKVPHLRFSGFSEVWKRFTIQELIDKKYIIGHLDGNHGELYPRNEEFTKNGIPYIAASDIVDGKISLTRCKFLPLLRAKSFKKGIAKTGDVIFAHNATVGPTGILETNYEFAILSTTVTYFRCNSKELSNIFLKNLFTHDYFIHQYTRVMSQSTRNQVPITTQRKFLVNIPHIQEQQKIASFLSSIDDWIENLKKQKSSLESYKNGLMQKIFSQEIRFKDENANKFSDWEENKLGYAVEVSMGQSPDSKAYNSNRIGLYLIQGNADIKNRRTSPRFWTSEITKTCEIGDIILTVRAPSGYVAISDHHACIGRGVCAIKAKKNANINFIYQFLLWFEPKWISVEQGSTFTAISGEDIKKVKITLPSVEEQKKIADFLTSLDNLIESKQQNIIQTEQWKKGLMQQLFV